MKKFILSALVAVGLVASVRANTAVVTVAAGTYTNILGNNANFGSALITSIWVQNSSLSSNVTVSLIDSPTNQLTYSWNAYSNTIYYATNTYTVYTNYYGVVQTNTFVGGTLYSNINLIQVTNNLVPAGTNSYPIRFSATVPVSSTAQYTGLKSYFDQGVWATNSGNVPATITIQY